MHLNEMNDKKPCCFNSQDILWTLKQANTDAIGQSTKVKWFYNQMLFKSFG